MKGISLCLAFAMSLLLGCAGPVALTSEPKGTVQGMREAPHKLLPSLPADDKEEFELAQRGLIASKPGLVIRTREEENQGGLDSYRGVLNYKSGKRAAHPDATVILTRNVLDTISLEQATFPGRILAGDIKIEGSIWKFFELMSCMDKFEFWFNIVTP